MHYALCRSENHEMTEMVFKIAFFMLTPHYQKLMRGFYRREWKKFHQTSLTSVTEILQYEIIRIS